MIIKSTKINENYAAEFTALSQYQSINDGLSVIEFSCNFDWFIADHNPKFEVSLRMFNYTIFEFLIYNVNHVDAYV